MITIVFAVWYITTRENTVINDLKVPSPELVLKTLTKQYSVLTTATLVTCLRVFLGMIAGCLLGFFNGLLMSYSKKYNFFIDPIIEIIRPVPPVALAPFFILWLGVGNISQILMIVLGSFMIITVSTYESVRTLPKKYEKVARTLGASSYSIYTDVIIPAVTPYLLSAVRVTLASSIALTIAAEYIGAQGGLGFLIRNSIKMLQTEMILLIIIILGVISLIFDKLIRFFFSKMTQWNY